MSDNAVGALAIILIFGMPILYAIVNRTLAHQERLEMIRRGVTPPPDPRWARKMYKSKWYDPSCYGVGPSAPQQPGAYDYGAMAQYQADRTMRKGVTLAMVGIALLVGLSFIGPISGMSPFGPWLLGGLIPLFIGIAQIIIAVLSGARLGPFGGMLRFGPEPWQQQSQQQAPPPGQQQAPFGQPPGPPYGWRPGSTVEIGKPVNPPDVKH